MLNFGPTQDYSTKNLGHVSEFLNKIYNSEPEQMPCLAYTYYIEVVAPLEIHAGAKDRKCRENMPCFDLIGATNNRDPGMATYVR